MGRHGRSAAVPAAVGQAEVPGNRHRSRARRRKGVAAPVRTGLLGVSAAVAVGAVAMASGLLPGGNNYSVDGTGGGDQVRADGVPDLQTQGGESVTPTAGAPSSPAKSATAPAHAPSTSPSPGGSTGASRSGAKASAPTAKRTKAPADRTRSGNTPPTHSTTTTATPERSASARATASTAPESAAAAAVLSLVNQQRATAGCQPVRANTDLAALAGAFSDDMAARGFFDHTDPDGDTPWDRADQAGVKGLGGENIARGQADAAAVMEAWMNSPGHRANILNCGYKTLGVGVHLGAGGPWWTQDFGF